MRDQQPGPDATQIVAVHTRGAELRDAFSGTLVRYFDSRGRRLDDLDISPAGDLVQLLFDKPQIMSDR